LRAHKLEAVTHNTICDPDTLITEIKRVRSLGYAFDRGEGSMLAICVGAPIHDSSGKAIAAMSISGPATRFNPRKGSPVIAALLKATTEVSRQFAQLVPKWEKSASAPERKK
jgi:IclR family acetate operon transcriptional repressor